jgi:hypothetical protein
LIIPDNGGLHRHHICPLSRGGSDTKENCTWLCETCHILDWHQQAEPMYSSADSEENIFGSQEEMTAAFHEWFNNWLLVPPLFFYARIVGKTIGLYGRQSKNTETGNIEDIAHEFRLSFLFDKWNEVRTIWLTRMNNDNERHPLIQH